LFSLFAGATFFGTKGCTSRHLRIITPTDFAMGDGVRKYGLWQDILLIALSVR
jgi:hypothetical protein